MEQLKEMLQANFPHIDFDREKHLMTDGILDSMSMSVEMISFKSFFWEFGISEFSIMLSISLSLPAFEIPLIRFFISAFEMVFLCLNSLINPPRSTTTATANKSRNMITGICRL